MSNEFDQFPIFQMYGNELSLKNTEILYQWKLNCLNVIEIIAGKNSIFYEKFLNSFKLSTFFLKVKLPKSICPPLKSKLKNEFMVTAIESKEAFV